MTTSETDDTTTFGVDMEFDTYKYNFYFDESYVYIIIDGVIGSDYGVLKLNRVK